MPKLEPAHAGVGGSRGVDRDRHAAPSLACSPARSPRCTATSTTSTCRSTVRPGDRSATASGPSGHTRRSPVRTCSAPGICVLYPVNDAVRDLRTGDGLSMVAAAARLDRVRRRVHVDVVAMAIGVGLGGRGVRIATNGFLVLHIVHMPFVASVVWMPFVLLGVDLLMDRWDDPAGVAARRVVGDHLGGRARPGALDHADGGGHHHACPTGALGSGTVAVGAAWSGARRSASVWAPCRRCRSTCSAERACVQDSRCTMRSNCRPSPATC